MEFGSIVRDGKKKDCFLRETIKIKNISLLLFIVLYYTIRKMYEPNKMRYTMKYIIVFYRVESDGPSYYKDKYQPWLLTREDATVFDDNGQTFDEVNRRLFNNSERGWFSMRNYITDENIKNVVL